MIERVEQKLFHATKLILSIFNLDYEERLETLSLTALADRRQRRDAIQMYKLMDEIDELTNQTDFR